MKKNIVRQILDGLKWLGLCVILVIGVLVVTDSLIWLSNYTNYKDTNSFEITILTSDGLESNITDVYHVETKKHSGWTNGHQNYTVTIYSQDPNYVDTPFKYLAIGGRTYDICTPFRIVYNENGNIHVEEHTDQDNEVSTVRIGEVYYGNYN